MRPRRPRQSRVSSVFRPSHKEPAVTRPIRTSRRQFLARSGNIIAAGSLAAALPMLARAQAKPMTVGFLYTGVRQDYGWNQAHVVAARQIAKLDGVKLLEQENVPETAESEKVM